MVNYFISVKAWKIFLLLILPLLVGEFSPLGNNRYGFALLIFYFLVVEFGWIYAIGSAANRRIDEARRLPLVYFQIACALPLLCFIFLAFGIMLPLSLGIQHGLSGWGIYVVFTALGGFAYSLWFTARQFVSLKNNYSAAFIECYPVFMALWFSPLGVWFLQPKVNALLSDNENETSIS